MDLQKIDFGNEAADDVSPEELASYFMEQDAFAKFLSPNKGLLVATARRGVGKSALLQWIALKVAYRESGDLIIFARGSDLVRARYNLTTPLLTPNDHIHDWMVRICSLINRHLAVEIGLALNDDEITLVETAEIEGFKKRNIIGCLVDRLQGLIGGGRSTSKIKSTDEISLLKRTKSGQERNVWLIIDDLDATFQKTDGETMSLCTFFSACRYLSRDVKGLNIRASVRTDVWPLIRRFDEATGKLDQYREEITWGQDDFRKLLALRIRASLSSSHNPASPLPPMSESEQRSLLNGVFVPKMQWGEKQVDAYKVIYTLSYERPRWAIQLCKLAQKEATRQHQNLITKHAIDQVWGEYGVKRIDDLVAEHRHQCPEIEEVLNCFRGAERLLTREQIITWIKNHISTHLEVFIDGKGVRDPLDIARFLYRIGFIVARSEDDDGSYEHYRFDQMPDFLSGRTNDDFNVKWELHPCYREALDIQKLNRSHKAQFGKLRGVGDFSN
jgi:hypothetical protein